MAQHYFNKTGVEHWHEQALGQAMHQVEQALLDKMLPQLFGYHLLYMDMFKNPFHFQASPIHHRICINDSATRSARMTVVKGSYDELPFATNSLDVVLISHVLEYSVDPAQIIKEASRVIVPEGHIIILGFNPYSLWGLRCLLPYPRNTQPWSGRFISARSVKKMLENEACAAVFSSHYFYRPPFTQKDRLNNAMILEKIGSVCWPNFGAAYAIVAKKKEAGLTPIKPHWLRLRKIRLKGILGTTTRCKS